MSGCDGRIPVKNLFSNDGGYDKIIFGLLAWNGLVLRMTASDRWSEMLRLKANTAVVIRDPANMFRLTTARKDPAVL